MKISNIFALAAANEISCKYTGETERATDEGLATDVAGVADGITATVLWEEATEDDEEGAGVMVRGEVPPPALPPADVQVFDVGVIVTVVTDPEVIPTVTND